MKNIFGLGLILLCLILVGCNASPSSPGGKLGSKNYNGNYTMGATSGPATTYLLATGDTLIELHYSLNSGPNTTITNITFKESGSGYSLNKTDGIGTLTGSTTDNFGILTWQYVTTGNTIGFTGNKIN